MNSVSNPVPLGLRRSFGFGDRLGLATADSVGNISNPDANVANYGLRADWNSQDGNVTTVGSAGALSASYYGTVVQGGNSWEGTEGIIGSSSHVMHGGSWSGAEIYLRTSYRNGYSAWIEQNDVGFRIARDTLTFLPWCPNHPRCCSG